jgi:hypothetical protein
LLWLTLSLSTLGIVLYIISFLSLLLLVIFICLLDNLWVSLASVGILWRSLGNACSRDLIVKRLTLLLFLLGVFWLLGRTVKDLDRFFVSCREDATVFYLYRLLVTLEGDNQSLRLTFNPGVEVQIFLSHGYRDLRCGDRGDTT